MSKIERGNGAGVIISISFPPQKKKKKKKIPADHKMLKMCNSNLVLLMIYNNLLSKVFRNPYHLDGKTGRQLGVLVDIMTN